MFFKQSVKIRRVFGIAFNVINTSLRHKPFIETYNIGSGFPAGCIYAGIIIHSCNVFCKDHLLYLLTLRKSIYILSDVI